MLKEIIDGFDYVTVANSTRKWDNATGGLITGVFGVGSALQGPVARTKTLSAAYATGFDSFYFFTGTLASCIIAGFADSGTTQCDLRMDATGHLFFTRNGTTLGSVTAAALAPNTWYNMVVKVTVNNSSGAMEVYVDLASFLAVSSQDTQNSANASFNQLIIDSASNRTQAFDHFMFWDTTSGTGNDLTTFPTSPLVVDTAWVTGAGANADWTPLSSTNASNVDETNSDDDTTYNSSTTVNNVDTFAVGSLHATSGTVIAIAVNTMDRIDDATAHTVSHRIKSSSATVDGTAFSLSSTYKNHQTIFTLDPNTSAAPTVSARNAMNFGYKLVS